MFSAFGNGDVDKFVETVPDNTIWIYLGTQIIPKGVFEKKEEVRIFFSNILDKTEIINFEHQKVKESGRELKQKWVQIYTVENELITRMEEFATSEEVR